MIRFVLIALFIISLVGCDRDEPNPEVRDPIFQDLKKQAERYSGIVKEEEKKLEELYKDLKKAEPNTVDIKNVRKNIAKSQKIISDSKQLERYYKIRMERRRVVDKISAKRARLSSQKWPNPDEYSDYQVSSRLKSAHRNWSERVPKLQERLTNKAVEGESTNSSVEPAKE